VFTWHKLFSTEETIARVSTECRTAAIGCVECKGLMADGLVRWIQPMRERRADYEAHPQKVWEILEEGSRRARKVAKKTMRRVREAIFG
jgi:tryptophanyl-tRNA synthetase